MNRAASKSEFLSVNPPSAQSSGTLFGKAPKRSNWAFLRPRSSISKPDIAGKDPGALWQRLCEPESWRALEPVKLVVASERNRPFEFSSVCFYRRGAGRPVDGRTQAGRLF